MPMPNAIQIPHTHIPGNHCGSTALSDLARFHGLPWSEAMCFGLGSGLGLFYGKIPGMSPTRLVHVRSGGFEEQFFKRIGDHFAWQFGPDPLETEAQLKAALAAGYPAIVLSNIKYLPYYNTETSFPGHLIAVWGYDDAKQAFSVSDTERPELQTVPYEAMRKARYARNHPLQHSGHMYAPASLTAPADLDARIQAAIVDNAQKLNQPNNPMSGLGALNKWLADLDDWQNDKDWQWSARFTYQIIEKRGTGGGGFRKMYGEFLAEAEARLPQLKALGLAAAMRRSASAWTDLALTLKATSENERPEFGGVRNKLEIVGEAERAYIDLVEKL